MFEETSKVRPAWLKLGERIVADKPKGLVVVSSYWVNDERVFELTDAVVVNEDTNNPPVYKYDLLDRKLQRKLEDQFYHIRFWSHGDAAMLEAIKKSLTDGSVKFSTAKRGLDNGVFGEFILPPR